MRRALIVIGVSFLFVLPSWSAVAAPRLEWTRQFPGWVMAVDTSSSGVTAAVGSRWAPGGHQTMSIVVYGPQGGQRWQGRGGPPASLRARARSPSRRMARSTWGAAGIAWSGMRPSRGGSFDATRRTAP